MANVFTTANPLDDRGANAADSSSDTKPSVAVFVLAGVVGITVIAIVLLLLGVRCWRAPNAADISRDGSETEELSTISRPAGGFMDTFEAVDNTNFTLDDILPPTTGYDEIASDEDDDNDAADRGSHHTNPPDLSVDLEDVLKMGTGTVRSTVWSQTDEPLSEDVNATLDRSATFRINVLLSKTGSRVHGAMFWCGVFVIFAEGLKRGVTYYTCVLSCPRLLYQVSPESCFKRHSKFTCIMKTAVAILLVYSQA